MAFADNETHRFGSAGFAEPAAIARAGMFRQTPDSLFIGYLGDRPLWYDGPGGVLLVAGARGGKLRDILAYNVCSGVYARSLVALDLKGELAAVSMDQTEDGKFCAYWNPATLHGLPQDRINPLDYIRADSPTLVADIKVLCQNLLPPSGSANAAYFEQRASEFLEGIAFTVTRLKSVLTFPDLVAVINLIPGGGDAWLDFAFEMSESGFPLSVRVEEEIAASRENPSNGFQGIIGELLKAFACFSDPVLMASVSPPFTFSFSQLCQDERAWQVYLMPPAEHVDAWAPVLKAMFVAAMIYKSRAPAAPRQTWVLDEAAQLGGFPLIPKLFTYGAGIGIRPLAVFQSLDQLHAIAPHAGTIIPSSAACRIFFAIRDISSASALSHMLGSQTLEYDDGARQAQAAFAKQQALQSLLNGGDPFAAGLAYRHHKIEAERRSMQHRLLRTADEVLNTPPGKAYVFVDGVEHPIYADRRPYYEQRWMAGRYHPNPFHPPLDRVAVKLRFGTGTRPVVRERVPARFAHFPQYRDGYWSKVKA